MSGKKGRSGRRKNPVRAIYEYIVQDTANIPEYLNEMRAQATLRQSIDAKCPHCGKSQVITVPGGGNYQALAWLLDRHYGKAPQNLNVKSEAIVLTGENYGEIAKQIEAMQARALAVSLESEPVMLETGSLEPQAPEPHADR